MFLTSKNDLLYDAKNFNCYNNVYTILVNKRKQENFQKLLTFLAKVVYCISTHLLRVLKFVKNFEYKSDPAAKAGKGRTWKRSNLKQNPKSCSI